MQAWESLQKTLDYIEEHGHEEITIDKLAKIASLSSFYYQRLFVKFIKKPVQEYIDFHRSAKVSKTHDFVLGSHKSLARSFKTSFGFTLAEFRNNPSLLTDSIRRDLLMRYMLVDEGVPLVVDGMVLEIRRKTPDTPIEFTGVSSYSRIDELMSAKMLSSANATGEIWGRLIQKRQDNFAGFVEVDDSSGGFLKWHLPVREYVVCGFEVESFDKLITDSIHKAGNFVFSWLAKHGLNCDNFTAELYHGKISDTVYMETWYPIVNQHQDILALALLEH